MTNAERRELKRRFDSVERRIQKYESVPDELRKELTEIDPTDFQALLAKQAEISEAENKLAALEDEWLELAERLGIS